MFAIIVLIFLTVLTDGKLPGGKDAMSLYGFGNAALFCAAGVLILKKLIFNPRRNGKVEELRTILSSDHNYRSTLEMLKQLDPDMIKNIRKYITHMPLEELSG